MNQLRGIEKKTRIQKSKMSRQTQREKLHWTQQRTASCQRPTALCTMSRKKWIRLGQTSIWNGFGFFRHLEKTKKITLNRPRDWRSLMFWKRKPTDWQLTSDWNQAQSQGQPENFPQTHPCEFNAFEIRNPFWKAIRIQDITWRKTQVMMISAGWCKKCKTWFIASCTLSYTWLDITWSNKTLGCCRSKLSMSTCAHFWPILSLYNWDVALRCEWTQQQRLGKSSHMAADLPTYGARSSHILYKLV